MKIEAKQLSLFAGLTFEEIDLVMIALIRAIELYEDIKSAQVFAKAAYDYLLCDTGRRISNQKSIEWGMMLLGHFDEKSSEIESSLEQMYEELESVRNLLQKKIQ